MSVGLFVGVWIARYLGPEQFGILSYAQAFVALFSALATLGLDSIVIRDIVREPQYKDMLLGTAFILKLSGGIIAISIAFCSVLLTNPDDVQLQLMVMIISSSIIFQSFNTIDFWFRAEMLSKYTAYSNILGLIIISLIKIYLIITSAPLIAFVWAGVGEIIIVYTGSNRRL